MESSENYETELSGTVLVPASVSKCPTPPRGFAKVGIVAYDGLFRFVGIIQRYYRESSCGIVEGYPTSITLMPAPQRVFYGWLRCGSVRGAGVGQNQ